MLSLVVIGEYNEFKQLVRDGVKNLHDAEGLPDEALLAINRPRPSTALSSSQQQELLNQLSLMPSVTMSSSFSSEGGTNHHYHHLNEFLKGDMNHETIRSTSSTKASTRGASLSTSFASMALSGRSSGGSSSGNVRHHVQHIPKMKSLPRDRIISNV